MVQGKRKEEVETKETEGKIAGVWKSLNAKDKGNIGGYKGWGEKDRSRGNVYSVKYSYFWTIWIYYLLKNKQNFCVTFYNFKSNTYSFMKDHHNKTS